MPGLTYCQRVGNLLGGTVFMALAATIDQAFFRRPNALAVFPMARAAVRSFSAAWSRPGRERLRRFEIEKHLNECYQLSMDELMRS